MSQPYYHGPMGGPPAKRTSTGMIIGLVAAGLALLAILGMLGWVLTKPKDPTPPVTSTQPAPTSTSPAPTSTSPAPTSTSPVPTSTSPAPTTPTAPTSTNPVPTTTAPTTPAPGGQTQPIDKGVSVTVPAGYTAKQIQPGAYVFKKGNRYITVQVYQAKPNAQAVTEMTDYMAQLKPKFTNPQVIPVESRELNKPGTGAYGGMGGAFTSGGSTRQIELHSFIMVRSADSVAALVTLDTDLGTVKDDDQVIQELQQFVSSARASLFP